MKKLCLLLVVGLMVSFLQPSRVCARNATSYTYTLSDENEWELTQDAYKPAGVLLREVGLDSPEDICVYENKIYVADTGNGRVICYDRDTCQYEEIAKGLFQTPTGIFVNQLGIFVADRGKASGYWLDFEGNLIKDYPKPAGHSYGKSTVYLPLKIVADSKANVYILSSGTYQGLVQFDDTGEFVGFFAANTTKLTVVEWLQNILFTEEQKAKLFHKNPTGFNNVTIHPINELVYSLTPGDLSGVKLHSVDGSNILSNYEVGEQRYEAVALGANQEIFVTTTSGIIYVYSSNGEFLYSFGGQATAVDLAGYATIVSAIAVDSDNCIYLLDKQRGFIHTYIPTDFACYIFRALQCFENGNFAESSQYWGEVLKRAPNFRAAFNDMATAYMQQGDYEQALAYYRRANNHHGYSEAKWELRNAWMNQYFATLIIGIIILWSLWKVAKQIIKRTSVAAQIERKRKELAGKKIMIELSHIMYTIRHPIDCFYYIKRGQRCSVSTAILIYIASFAVFIWDQAGKGFIFNRNNIMYLSPVYFVAIFLLPLMLWVVCSYMVSAVMYGEGKFRAIFIGAAYMLSPYLLFMPIVNLLSYVLTSNEGFVIKFSCTIIWSYVLLLLFFSVKEINNYSTGKTLGSIAISVFFIIIVVVAFSIVYMLCNECVEMITTIIKEAIYRV